MADYRNNSRFFTDSYDYNNLFGKMGTDDIVGNKGCIARLRLDSIFFKKIVLTDAQLFHSIFFSEAVTMKADLGEISEYIPIHSLEIRCRQSSLEETLVSLIYDPNEPYLKYHLFTYIDTERVIGDRLKTVPSADLGGDYKKIPEILIKLGADETRVAKSFKSWVKWIELSKNRSLAVEKWNKPREFYNSELNSIIELEKAFISKNVDTLEGQKLLLKVLESRLLRGEVTSHLGNYRKESAENLDVLNDVHKIEEWYNSCINRTLSKQHDCTRYERNQQNQIITESVKVYDEEFSLLEKNLLTNLTLISKVPEGFLTSLCDLPPQEFTELVGLFEKRLEKWHFGGDIEELRYVIDKLVETVDKRVGFEHPDPRLKNFVNYLRKLIYIARIGSKAALKVLDVEISSAIIVGIADEALKYADHKLEKSADKLEIVSKNIVDYAQTRTLL